MSTALAAWWSWRSWRSRRPQGQKGPRGPRGAWRAVLPGLVALHVAATPAAAEGLSDAARRGAALYDGTVALRARLVGHDTPLPPAAVRCVNCHDAAASTSTTVQDAAVGSLGPPLDARHLLPRLPRRGGPPSRFDADSLCRLLRTGVDPASVMIRQLMPRYDLDDRTCRDLWAWLYERPTP